MRKWNCILILFLVLMGQLASSTSAHAAAHWGEFRAGACVSMGKRLYSAILWGIEYGKSWEAACAIMPATVNGVRFNQPSKCVNTGANMWGEFHVPDATCPVWGEARREFCSGSGIRQYSAILWDIPAGVSWDEACKATPITINGDTLKAERCVSTGLNMWGNFKVADSSCIPSEADFVKAMTGTGFSDACIRADFKEGEAIRATDGCSPPLTDPATLLYKDSFYPACVVHDYCYAMPWAGRRGEGKDICDGIMLNEMYRICEGWGNDRTGCDTAARVWATFVRISPIAAGAYNAAQKHRDDNPLPQCN